MRSHTLIRISLIVCTHDRYDAGVLETIGSLRHKRFFRPASIPQLVLIGFVVVALPLAAAMVTAVIKVEQLAARNRSAVVDAQLAIEYGRTITKQITEMRRAFGQYAVLKDAEFHRAYLSRRESFLAAATHLSVLDIDANLQTNLAVLIVAERKIYNRLHDADGLPVAGDDSRDLDDEWSSLSERARVMVEDANLTVASKANAAVDDATALQKTLLLSSALALAAAVTLAIIFVLLITRPLRRIDQCIRTLGSGQFSEPVAISGPGDLEKLGVRLDWLRRRIVELEDQKMTFLRHISHELKTPLAAIREGSQLLKSDPDDKLDGEQQEIVQILQDSSRDLQSLIEDLLEFGKSAIPSVDYQKSQSVALEDLIRNAVGSQTVMSSAKKLQIDTDVEPIYVLGNLKLLRVVINNLLSNAVKFTPERGRIGVCVRREGDVAVIDIQDDGPGVTNRDRDKIFEPFYQGDNQSTGSLKGTGLGLAIVHQYITAHEGSVEFIDSTVGAHVRVRLPNLASG